MGGQVQPASVNPGACATGSGGLLYDSADAPLPEEVGFPWGAERPRASMLGVMERITGVRIPRDWLLHSSRPTFELLL